MCDQGGGVDEYNCTEHLNYMEVWWLVLVKAIGDAEIWRSTATLLRHM